MYCFKSLEHKVLAGLIVVGLGACVSTPQPLPPRAELSQQTEPQVSVQGSIIPGEDDGQRFNDGASMARATAEIESSLLEQAKQSEPLAVASSEKKLVKAKKCQPAASSDCYRLSPGAKKSSRGAGRCEPQSLPYARCRSGIRTCNLGNENGPLTWFSCEKKAGNTSPDPKPESVLILGSINKHRMPTGHVLYVESVFPLTSSSAKLILSHTNFDRKCSKETKIEATYNRSAMTLDILSGAWKAWGHDLKVAGFVLR